MGNPWYDKDNGLGVMGCAKLVSHSFFKYAQHVLENEEVLKASVDPDTTTKDLVLGRHPSRSTTYASISKSGRLQRPIDARQRRCGAMVEKKQADEQVWKAVYDGACIVI